MLKDHQKLFHLNFYPEELNSLYAILPGAPERAVEIAKKLSEYEKVAQSREFSTYKGTINGVPVAVCSTGIGGPSASIAVEELYEAGVRYFIRIGTCGGINTDVKAGDIIIASSAVRQEGTTLHYAPIEYPAVADFKIVSALAESAEEITKGTKRNYHVGVVQSKDSFYGQHSPERMPVKNELLQKWGAWKSLGVLGSEMESAAVFITAASLHAKAGAVLHCIWNQEQINNKSEDLDTTPSVDCVIEAIKRLIEKNK